MVGSNTGVGDVLALVSTILDKIFGPKRCIVGVVLFDSHAVFASPAFEFMLGFEGLADSERDLM
jgi:hypothetical protein